MMEYADCTLYAICDRCHNPLGILGSRDAEALGDLLKKFGWEFDLESGACRCPECND